MERNLFYNKKLKGFARANRKNPTKAERVLWYEILCKRQMLGYKFLRQRSVDNYIADFMCKDLRLVIEVDGSIHDSPEAQAKDLVRQNKLEKLGFTVIRFSNWEVLNNMHLVVTEIEKTIYNLEKS